MNYMDELYHSGILGMHWGRRRFQYEDGSLTPLGRIRYSKSKGNKISKNVAKEKVKAKKKASKKKTEQPIEKKSLSPDYKKKAGEYTDEELAAVIKRLKLEVDYNSQIKSLTPARMDKGKKFADKLETIGKISDSTLKLYKNANAFVATTNLIKKNLHTGGTEGAKTDDKKKDKKK